MGRAPASHFLRIYQIRLANHHATRANTPPVSRHIAFAERLVARLKTLDPDTPVALAVTDRTTRFTNATTGELLEEIDWVADI
jgi:hypothetical protein